MKFISLITTFLFAASVTALPSPSPSPSSTTTSSSAKSSATAVPKFYLQIANGTYNGQYLTAPTYIPTSPPPYRYATGLVTWTNHLSNASEWTFSVSGSVTLLGLVTGQPVVVSQYPNNPNINPILIGDKQGDPISPENVDGVFVILKNWSNGAPTGAFLDQDVDYPQFNSWAISNGAVAMTNSGATGLEKIAIRYLRISK